VALGRQVPVLKNHRTQQDHSTKLLLGQALLYSMMMTDSMLCCAVLCEFCGMKKRKGT